MNDNKYWAVIWSLVCFFMVVLVSGLLMYFSHKNTLIAKEIESIGDPISVMCALDGGGSNTQLCTMKMIKELANGTHE
jgi:hypothetical protein